MSDRVRALVWDWYDEKWGAPMILAIALADASNDAGAGIAESAVDLAKKTRQTERAVRKQLRQLEAAGLLVIAERSAGGRGNVTRYRLDLGMLVRQEIGQRDNDSEAAKPGTAITVSGAETVNGDQGLPAAISDHHIYALKEPSTSNSASSVPAFTVSGDQHHREDQRLARWMFDRILALHPKHREPGWRAWHRDLRRMREIDRHSHRDIAELFAWANRDPFWQANVLSPGTLRRQWDRLVIQRNRAAGSPSGGEQTHDRHCAREIGGRRCGLPGVRSDGTHLGAKWFCAGCAEELDRRAA